MILLRRRFFWALALSLLLHGMLIYGPGWRFPWLDDLLSPPPPEPLAARLHVPAPPSRPAPRPAAKPEPTMSPSAMASAAQAPEMPPAAAAPPAQAQEPPAPQPSAATMKEPTLPRQGRIRYGIMQAESGLSVGLSEHRWEHDGAAYAIRTVAETTGLAAIFRPARVTQVSEGDIGADGLRPRAFRTERNGAAGDAASFDWAAGRLTMSRGIRESPLEAGMQDTLSMFYQLALLRPGEAGAGLTVATGRKVERFVFAQAGVERIATPAGEWSTVRLRTIGTQGGDKTEVWLAPDLSWLPLKIRHVDRKGEVYDQMAEEIEIDGNLQKKP